MVNRLENILVQLFGLVAVKRHPHQYKHIRQALDADTDGSIFHIADTRLLRRIEIDVDHAVQVRRDDLGDAVQRLEIEGLRFLFYKRRQRNGRQIADRGLVRVAVFHDLRAQIGALDRAQILLVGLHVGRVLVQQVRRARLHLRVEDLEPQVARLHRPACLAL